MVDDWNDASISRIGDAAARLRAAIDGTVTALSATRTENLAEGGSADAGHAAKRRLMRDGNEFHLAPTQAFRDFERALSMHRARVVRELVDEQHLTFSEVGELVSVSRQMIARLYRSAVDCSPIPESAEDGSAPSGP